MNHMERRSWVATPLAYACVWQVYVAARLAQLPEQQPRPMQLQQRHAHGAADGGDGEAELRRREAA